LDDDIGWHDFMLRNYDAQIGRWVQQDPYQQFASPYVGMGNDPINNTDPSGGIVIDPIKTLETVVITATRAKPVAQGISILSGLSNVTKLAGWAVKVSSAINTGINTAQAGDIIHVNAEGYITKVEEVKGGYNNYNKVINEKGEELCFNDCSFDNVQLEGIIGDKNYRYTADWNGEDKTRLFTPLSNQKMSDIFNGLSIGEIRKTYKNLVRLSKMPYGLSGATALAAYITKLGHYDFDFADDMAAFSKEGGNSNQGLGKYPPDGTGGFIKFQNSNTLYNIYDAGNFMTGKAFSLIGQSEGATLRLARTNSRITLNGKDTEADQNALSAGHNYKGVSW
jgi:hypothetical protein